MPVFKNVNNISVFLSAIVLSTFLVLAHVYGVRFQWRSSLISFSIVIVFIIYLSIAFKTLSSKSPQKKSLRNSLSLEPLKDWIPLVAIITIFENLREFTGVINPHPLDSLLYEMDLKLFGVEPTLWSQQFVNPFLTDMFSFFYAIYFLLPLLLALHFYWSKRSHCFQEMSLGLGLCFYLGFLSYILFPAGPPRFYFGPEIWQAYPALVGKWGLFEKIHGFANSHNPIMHYASFPSMHVALASLSTIYAFKLANTKGRLLWGTSYTILSIGIILSTIYLRHHWVPDIFAGIFLATLAATMAHGIVVYANKTTKEIQPDPLKSPNLQDSLS